MPCPAMARLPQEIAGMAVVSFRGRLCRRDVRWIDVQFPILSQSFAVQAVKLFYVQQRILRLYTAS